MRFWLIKSSHPNHNSTHDHWARFWLTLKKSPSESAWINFTRTKSLLHLHTRHSSPCVYGIHLSQTDRRCSILHHASHEAHAHERRDYKDRRGGESSSAISAELPPPAREAEVGIMLSRLCEYARDSLSDVPPAPARHCSSALSFKERRRRFLAKLFYLRDWISTAIGDLDRFLFFVISRV